jgi:DNA-binding MarR family transcriptional regulator
MQMLYNAAIMARTPADAELARLAQELDRSWSEIGRIFVSRRLGTSFQEGLSVELSPIQLLALSILSDGPVRIRDLAAGLGLAESTVTRLVDRLEDQGFVVRRAQPSDRRSVVVRLTGSGRRVADAVAAKRRMFLTTMLEALGPTDRRQFVRLFGRIAAVRRELERDAPPIAAVIGT